MSMPNCSSNPCRQIRDPEVPGNLGSANCNARDPRQYNPVPHCESSQWMSGKQAASVVIWLGNHRVHIFVHPDERELLVLQEVRG